jgi:hypothetical protein
MSTCRKEGADSVTVVLDLKKIRPALPTLHLRASHNLDPSSGEASKSGENQGKEIWWHEQNAGLRNQQGNSWRQTAERGLRR